LVARVGKRVDKHKGTVSGHTLGLSSDGNAHGLRHTPPVFHRRKWATIVWVAAISLLPMRFANAHLHLCADGQAAPVSLHIQDAPTHFEAASSASTGHDDRDIDVPASQAIFKAGSADHLTPACIGQSFFIVFLRVAADEPVPQLSASPDLGTPSDLRPPTRGPPRQA
jgi:hypothetical protein